MAKKARQTAGASRTKSVRLLFTCAGRRVELINAFRAAAKALSLKPVIHTADADPLPAAACVADHAHHVPPARSSTYVAALLRLVEREKIDLLIPLIDDELLLLARARQRFAALNCTAMISSPYVVEICRDKLATFEFLRSQGIDTPDTWRVAEVLNRARHQFPYFLKPRRGSASKGNFILKNKAELKALAPLVQEGIIQEFIDGVEHTLDVYTGFDGKPRCVVPRRRIEVRGGEVVTAQTVNDKAIIDTGVWVAEAFAECVGLVTIQLIRTSEGRISVIEINPRFGGGAPLGIKAGADSPRWILSEWMGKSPRIRINHFKPDMVMLRYHDAFFRTVPTPRRHR